MLLNGKSLEIYTFELACSTIWSVCKADAALKKFREGNAVTKPRFEGNFSAEKKVAFLQDVSGFGGTYEPRVSLSFWSRVEGLSSQLWFSSEGSENRSSPARRLLRHAVIKIFSMICWENVLQSARPEQLLCGPDYWSEWGTTVLVLTNKTTAVQLHDNTMNNWELYFLYKTFSLPKFIIY